MFTSELPSNFSTPIATGSNTPMPQAQLSHHGAGVNPLLLAATTASNPMLGVPGQQPLPQTLPHQHVHSGPRQTPTSIKTLRLPDYFSDWKEIGTEEAMFLGAQVAAKVLFIVDQGATKGFMSRAEYNESGPQGIHEYTL
jgi:actin-related protein 9